MKKIILSLIIIVSCFACDPKESPMVVGVHDIIQFERFKKKGLDTQFDNLLNPKFSTKEVYAEVVNSWRGFHTNVQKVLKEYKFDWKVDDTAITIVNKIYFNKNGTIKYYLVNIKNDAISNETKDQFVKLLEENLSKLSIGLQRDQQFSQCGKIKYKNYE